MTDRHDIEFHSTGPLTVVTMNRPRALNALTLPMIRAFDPRLAAWAKDPTVRAVVIRGAGGKAFCAGGDVRAVYEAGKAATEGRGDWTLPRSFFREEYILNRRIQRFPKPYVALLDGITMGGGVGLSVHGSHRIVTEKTLIAMPETGIGLFPDVGGSYFLSRCPGEIGTYLALTGARLNAADALYAGIGTAFVPGERLDALTADLAAAEWTDDGVAVVDAVVARHVEEPEAPSLAEHRREIDRCFAFDEVEGIFGALEAAGTEWATGTLEVLGKMSPTSLKVTLRAIRLGARLSFDDAMTMEYRLSQAFMQGHDFYEGIRAVLVDRDRNPKWNPRTLEAVTSAEVDGFFAALGERDLCFAD